MNAGSTCVCVDSGGSALYDVRAYAARGSAADACCCCCCCCWPYCAYCVGLGSARPGDGTSAGGRRRPGRTSGDAAAENGEPADVAGESTIDDDECTSEGGAPPGELAAPSDARLEWLDVREPAGVGSASKLPSPRGAEFPG